jgi:hypothetical protein
MIRKLKPPYSGTEMEVFVGSSKKCLVSFVDEDGVKHMAEVVAESLYEASALALKQFRRSDWSREASFETGTLRVEVFETSSYSLLVSDLEAWLKKSGGSPREMTMRNNIRSKLEER